MNAYLSSFGPVSPHFFAYFAIVQAGFAQICKEERILEATASWLKHFAPELLSIKESTIKLLGEDRREVVESFRDQILLADVVSRLLGVTSASVVSNILEAIPEHDRQQKLFGIYSTLTMPGGGCYKKGAWVVNGV